MSISQRHARILVAIGVVAGFVAAPVLATLLSPSAAPATGTVPVASSGDGPHVDVVNAGNITLTSEAWPNEQTVVVQTDHGNVTFKSSKVTDAEVTAGNITGAKTTVSNLDLNETDLYINPEDKPAINISGGTDWVRFGAMNPDDGNPDFTYSGTTGETTITVRGLSADSEYRAVDATTGTVLGIGKTDGSGTITFQSLPHSTHQVEIKTGSRNPVLENPTPDENVTDTPNELSIDVSDEDFPGDNVTTKFYLEGTLVDTVYATSDGTYSTTNVTNVSPGQTEWSVVATDENNNTDIANATFGTPGSLTIRNETNSSEILDKTTITVRFQQGDTIQERTVSDGTVDLRDIGTGRFVVELDPQSTYYQRTIVLQNTVGNKSAYLLNNSATAVESRFTLNDPTGQFPSGSTVIIKRAIERNGTNAYRTIHADAFGTEGVTVDLEQNTRYQIYVRSPDGTVQAVGPYRADVSEDVTVRPGTPNIEIGSYEEGWGSEASVTNRTLEYLYSDPDNATQSVKIYIHEKGNASNKLQPNVTYYEVGTVQGSIQLSPQEANTTWVVEYIVNRNGEQYTVREESTNNADLVPTNLDAEWRLVFGVGVLLISAGVFSVLNRGVGAVVVALEGGILYFLGFLDGATTGAGVIMALFVAVISHAYTSRGV